jgi:hypothetical protein
MDELKSYVIVEFINETDVTLFLEFKSKDVQSLSVLPQRSLSKNFKAGEYIYTVNFRDTYFQDKVNFKIKESYRLNLKEIHDTFVNPDL